MRRNAHFPQYSGMLVGNPVYEVTYKDIQTERVLAQHSFTGEPSAVAEEIDNTIDAAGWRRHSFYGSFQGGPIVVYVTAPAFHTQERLLHNPYTFRTRLVSRRGSGRSVVVDMMKMTPSQIYAIVPGMGKRIFNRRDWRVSVGA